VSVLDADDVRTLARGVLLAGTILAVALLLGLAVRLFLWAAFT